MICSGLDCWDTIKFLTGEDENNNSHQEGLKAEGKGSKQEDQVDLTSASASQESGLNEDQARARHRSNPAHLAHSLVPFLTPRVPSRFISCNAYKWFCMDTKLPVLLSMPATAATSPAPANHTNSSQSSGPSDEEEAGEDSEDVGAEAEAEAEAETECGDLSSCASSSAAHHVPTYLDVIREVNLRWKNITEGGENF